MSGRVMDIKNELNKTLRDKSKPWTALFDIAEQKTGVDRLYIFIGSLGIVALWLVFGYAAQLVSNTVTFLYPAYMSIHAIETKQKDDDTKWLTYWVVFALFSTVEYFADSIVSYFPLYWLIKCIGFIWLMIPTELNGSLFIYRRIIRPYFIQHHKSIDETINKAKEEINKAKEEVQKMMDDKDDNEDNEDKED